MAISVGGVGVWSMHFIGMQAMVIHDLRNDMDISIEYDIALTLVSLVAVIIFVFAGMWIATRDRVFFKSTTDVTNMLIEDGKNLSIKESRNKKVIRNLALFKGLTPLAAGGVIT
mmetsp:Transcript_8478/g.8604  ORF Transcript_8478/g.8604 Transcript_8478/m.8604 type:complete len:114 (+) Transcript_8478:237-578(+)